MRGRTTVLIFLALAALIAGGCRGISPDPEVRAQQIGKQIRCPVCRGVPIADSPSTLALQMMGIVREQVAAGRSDEEILQYFVDRYGEWALLRPKPEGMNLMIWVLPALFLVGGAGFIFFRRARFGKEG